MAKDYFQDITPPGSDPRARPMRPAPLPPATQAEPAAPEPGGKSIRNIPITVGRQRPRIEEMRDAAPTAPKPGGKGATRYWLWGGVLIAILALFAIALVALRPTSITVIPRAHSVVFDETARFTAYPAESAEEGTLAFTVESTTLEDSQVVSAQGTERVEEKASGAITVYNAYSADPVKLLKNTRFEAPGGLIFKAPAEVMVPGKKGTAPGQITITVIAEAPGEKYNVAAGRFTLPGLKSTPDMYKSVYAQSAAAMTGGFVGERPSIPQSTEDTARSEIRSRLQEKIGAATLQKLGESVVFPELARVTFETLPPTQESGGNVRMHERARIELPVFSADTFAGIIARSVSADAENGGVTLKAAGDFRAVRTSAESDPLTGPLEFTLEGSAQLIWNIDTAALSTALAGKDESAFQTIVQGFPGIEEAHARIEPFWKKSFPTDPKAIQIAVEPPASP